MKAISKMAFVAASLLVAGAAVGQTKPATPAMSVLVANSTANDAQAAITVRFAELLTRYSNGRIAAGARTGGSLGTNSQMLSTLQAGALAGMIIPTGFMAAAVPEIGMFDLPFLLPGAPAKMTEFTLRSKAAARMKESADQKGILVIGFYGVGSQSLLTRFPVTKLADIQGKLFRVIPSPPRAGAYKDWGAVPRTMDLAEVYSALQQGTIVGIENPPDVIYKMKLYEVAKYFTRTEHSAFLNAIVVSKKWLDALPKHLREEVMKAGKESLVYADELNTKAQVDALEAMRKDASITVADMPAAEIEKMKVLNREGVWKSMKNDPQRGAIVKLLEEDIANFRP
jgi:C4-dicarboxylate-binding protein DctP